MAAIEYTFPGFPGCKALFPTTAVQRRSLDSDGRKAEDLATADAIVAHLRTGRLLAADDWIDHHEAILGRALKSAKLGPKPKQGGMAGVKYTVPGFPRKVPGHNMVIHPAYRSWNKSDK